MSHDKRSNQFEKDIINQQKVFKRYLFNEKIVNKSKKYVINQRNM